MWPDAVERVAAELRAAAVEAVLEEFPEGAATAEAAAQAIGCSLAEVVKSLVFVCDRSSVLVLVPGDRRADEAKVAAATGTREVRVAHAREVLAATGYPPGAVAPFALSAIDTVLLEQSVLQHARIWVGAGSPSHMAGLPPRELQRLAGAKTADLVVPR
jgi:Cys-tRNA(Pro) deacylase